MTDKIIKPFSPEQIAALDLYQHSFWHPFTCGNNRGDKKHKDYAAKHGGDWGALVPTEDGWVCPVCGYKQDWAHAAMTSIVVEPMEGPFDLEPMGEHPLTHERVPTKNGIRPVMTQYCIYDHPADYPHNFVVRQWHIYEGVKDPVPGQVRLARALPQARGLVPKGLVATARSRKDDPTIVETWI